MMSDIPQPAPRTTRRAYGLAIGLVGVATVASASLRGQVTAPDIVMLYLLVIMIAATRFGRGPAVLAAALSVASYDFFFVTPLYTFVVADTRNLLTFATMFIVGIAISRLTSRIRREQAIAHSAELRARTEEMRNALLSAVSHDFRTPLATITGAASALHELRTTISESQRTELVLAICEEADRLERLVVNVLDMTRIQSGALELKRDWVPLEELTGSALARLEGKLAGRVIAVDIPPGIPLSFVDPVLVEQLFMNLLENACKYTAEGTPIDIVVDQRDGSVIVEVRDRGAGLADAEKVFQRFYRGAHVGIAGAGLGLPICRGICDAHGGSIAAFARAGGGTVFRVTLPAVSPPADLPETAEPADAALVGSR